MCQFNNIIEVKEKDQEKTEKKRRGVHIEESFLHLKQFIWKPPSDCTFFAIFFYILFFNRLSVLFLKDPMLVLLITLDNAPQLLSWKTFTSPPVPLAFAAAIRCKGERIFQVLQAADEHSHLNEICRRLTSNTFNSSFLFFFLALYSINFILNPTDGVGFFLHCVLSFKSLSFFVYLPPFFYALDYLKKKHVA